MRAYKSRPYTIGTIGSHVRDYIHDFLIFDRWAIKPSNISLTLRIYSSNTPGVIVSTEKEITDTNERDLKRSVRYFKENKKRRFYNGKPYTLQSV